MSVENSIDGKEFEEVRIGPRTYTIPKEWKITQIGEIANVEYGKSLPGSDGDIPAIGSSGIYNSVGDSLIQQDTIVIGRKGSAGEAYLVKGGCWPSDTTFYLTDLDSDLADIEFLHYYMSYNSLAEEIEQTTLPSLDRNRLETYRVLTPPIPEQHRIADILSTVDEQIQQTVEIIQERKELKRGLMQDLLLRGIGHKEFQERRLGLREISIPKSWSVQSADSIFDIKKTGFDPSEHTGEVYLYSMPAFDEGKKPLLTQAEEIGSKKRIVPNDTILFPKLNIRKKRFWRVQHNQNLPAICSTEYWPLTAKENIDLDFYTFYFQSYPFMSDPKVSSSSSTNSHKRVTQSSFKKVQLPVPPAEEQKKIANILNLSNKKIEQGYGRKKELLKLKRGLMQDLLTGTVRVDPEQAN